MLLNKPDKENSIFSLTCKIFFKKSNSCKKKVEKWMPEAGEVGNGEILIKV